jgi:hypothetical protein
VSEPTLPEWIDTDSKTSLGELESSGAVGTCFDCLLNGDLDVARASLNSVRFHEEHHIYQLMDKHGLRYVGESEQEVSAGGNSYTNLKQTFVAEDGLQVVVKPRADRKNWPSYVNIKGPAGAATVFYEDLLDTVAHIKRELRTLALVDIANEAEEEGRAVEDENRLVSRRRAAEVVDHLLMPETEDNDNRISAYEDTTLSAERLEVKIPWPNNDREAKTYEFRKEVERRGERLVVDSANLLPNTNTAVEVDCRVAEDEKYYTTRQHGKTYFTPVSVIEAGDRR